MEEQENYDYQINYLWTFHLYILILDFTLYIKFLYITLLLTFEPETIKKMFGYLLNVFLFILKYYIRNF